MKQSHLISVSIVAVGALIAVSIIFRDSSNIISAGTSAKAAERKESPLYIKGNPDASIKIVEFSDFECPFCARLHPTLEKIVNESDGTIAWEYRHLPLQGHKNAEEAAYAGECIGRLGGNDAFWAFAGIAFSNQRSFNTDFFEQEATAAGIDLKAFRSCIDSGDVRTAVQTDQDVAMSLGGRGTPFSVIIFEDGSTQTVSGALPYDQWAHLLNL